MRTFLSQLAAAKWSEAGLKRMEEMLSSGGFCTAMSLERSPWVGFAWLAADVCWPNSDDIVDVPGAVLLVEVLVPKGLNKDIVASDGGLCSWGKDLQEHIRTVRYKRDCGFHVNCIK